MNHQWAQFDHHDTLAFKLTDDEERELIRTQRTIMSCEGSLDDLIAEMTADRNSQKSNNHARQGI